MKIKLITIIISLGLMGIFLIQPFGHHNYVKGNEPNSQIVLNEFLPNPTGSDTASMPDGEWVELYNLSDQIVDLSGYYLTDADSSHRIDVEACRTNTGGVMIQPYGFLVVYRKGGGDCVSHGFTLNNTGDTINLYDNNDNLIDSCFYDVGGYCNLTPTPGSTNLDDPSGYCPNEISENKAIARIPDGTGEWVDGKSTASHLKFGEPVQLTALGSKNWGMRPESVGDINNDGKPDIVTADYDGGLFIITNDGNKNFSLLSQYPTGYSAHYPFVDDLNNDTYLDIMMAKNASPEIYVFLNNGQGVFDLTSYPVSRWATRADVADMNHDGYLDIVAPSGYGQPYVYGNKGGYLSLLINQGNGSFNQPQVTAFPYYLCYLKASDLDGDGDLDILASGGEPAFPPVESVLLRNTGQNEFVLEKVIPDYYNQLVYGDYNQDGLIDYTARFKDDLELNDFTLFTNQGDFEFELQTYQGYGDARLFADLNNDGWLDIITTKGVLLNNHGEFENFVHLDFSATFYANAAADMDGDGLVDLVGVTEKDKNEYEYNIAVSYQIFGSHPPTLSFPKEGVYAGDGIDPNSGEAVGGDNEFTLRVIYTDEDGDPPIDIQACLTDSPDVWSMCSGGVWDPSADFKQGVELLEEISWVDLGAGEYIYYFKTSDGTTDVRLPESGGFLLVINPSDAETCSDGKQNQGESDIDCGGPCSPCEDGKKCNVDSDCLSGYCQIDKICSEAPINLLPIRITNEPGDELDPDQSDDGQYIAMSSNRDGGTHNIWRMDSDGQTFVKLTDMPASGYSIARLAWNPVFHPDGDYIYYMDNSPSGGDFGWICRTKTDGTGGREEILLAPGGDGWDGLNFSPDGSLFTYHHVGYNEAGTRWGRNDIKVCDSQGSDVIGDDNPGGLGYRLRNIERVFGSRLISIYRDDAIANGTEVAWSPDGQKIYFFKTVQDDSTLLYSIDIQGDDFTNLIGVNPTRLQEQTLGQSLKPVISPDGKNICFQNREDLQSDWELYMISLDNLKLTRLTDNNFDDMDPTWSYNGNQIIYSSNADGDYDLYTIQPGVLSAFEMGDIVEVYNTGDIGLRIRSNPGIQESVKKIVPDDWLLEIINEPQEVETDEYVWWEVKETSHEPSFISGWTVEDYLKKVLAATITAPSYPNYADYPISFQTEWDEWANQTIAWAQNCQADATCQSKLRYTDNGCLHFVADAFRQGSQTGRAGWDSPMDAYHKLQNMGRFYPNQDGWGNSPAGALIFFSGQGSQGGLDYTELGHIGIYLGNGEIIHAYGGVLTSNIIDIEKMSLIDSYIGWAYPPQEWYRINENQPPYQPTFLFQYKSDETEIFVGNIIDEGSVIFKGKIDDPDGNHMKLQIELRRLDEYDGKFINEFTQESDYIPSGSIATTTNIGLVAGNYHWQARTVDEYGAASEWVSFGDNSDSASDFIIPKILPVPYYGQGNTEWCVPTSMSMILKYYGKNIHSWNIAKDWDIKRDEALFPAWDEDEKVEQYFISNNLLTNKKENDNINFDLIKKSINDDDPVFLSMRSGIGHAVVIVGYVVTEEDQIVYINDPSITLKQNGIGQGRDSIAREVKWNDLVKYFKKGLWGTGTYIVVASGSDDCNINYPNCNINYPKGTLNLDIGKGTIEYSNGFYFTYEKYKNWQFPSPLVSTWAYGGDKGIGWKLYGNHSLLLSKGDIFKYDHYITNQTADKQNYKLKIEFLADGFLPSAMHITSPINVESRRSKNSVMDFVLLKDLLGNDYGNYTINLSLWNDNLSEKYDEIILPEIEYKEEGTTITAKLNSSGELQVYDSFGNVTGLINGEIVEEIPDSMYDFENHIVQIFFASPNSYFYKVVGTDQGIYGLEVTSAENDEENVFVSNNIPITPDQTHQYTIDWQSLAQGNQGVTLQVDSSGDGVFEQTITSDEELTQEEFLINNPHWLKEQIQSNLQQAKTGNKIVDDKIDTVSEYIESSLDADLWQDDTHLNPDKGRNVFLYESQAVSRIASYLRLDKNSKHHTLPESVKSAFKQAVEDLIKADNILVQIALTEAQSKTVNNHRLYQRILDRMINKAQNKFDTAQGLETTDPKRAINYYGQAWWYAQMAIEYALK